MKIIGNNKIADYLDKSILKDKLAHAYLFSGPEHVGKFTLARQFAQEITSGKDAGANPDVVVVSPEISEKNGVVKKRDIAIGQIRQLRHALGLSSYGRRKAAIIDDANFMTVAAQNALLKTLEEPPKNTVIMIVCHNEENILPTVKSRCLIKRFALVGEDELAKAAGVNQGEGEGVVFWSFGRPGLMIGMISDKTELARRTGSLRRLRSMIGGLANDKFLLAEDLSKNITNTIGELEVWQVILREEALGKKMLGIKKEKAIAALDDISESINILKSTNSNTKLVLENLFLSL